MTHCNAEWEDLNAGVHDSGIESISLEYEVHIASFADRGGCIVTP